MPLSPHSILGLYPRSAASSQPILHPQFISFTSSSQVSLSFPQSLLKLLPRWSSPDRAHGHSPFCSCLAPSRKGQRKYRMLPVHLMSSSKLQCPFLIKHCPKCETHAHDIELKCRAKTSAFREIVNPTNNMTILYYEIEIRPFPQKIYSGDDMVPADLTGYNGSSPGPTFIVPRGQETVVRFINHSNKTNSVHLHGSYSVSISRPSYTGWANTSVAYSLGWLG